MFSFSKFIVNNKKADEKTLPPVQDINSNMAPPSVGSVGHPFLNGLKDIPEDKEEELNTLKQWLQKQPHLPPLTDNYLYLFLHSNYYNMEQTQETIETYFSIRTTAPELFANRSPNHQSIQQIWNMSEMIVLPKQTPEGYQILMYRLTEFEPHKLFFNDALKAFFLFNDIRLSEDGLAPGYIVVFDMKGVSLGHLTRINLSSIRKFMSYIQDGHPARLKGVHVINSVSFMDKILALVRPFMKSGLIKMLTIHGSDLTNLFKIVPQEIMPEDYGGKAGPVKALHEQHRKMVETKYEKWVAEEELYVMDLSKRPKAAKKQCFITSSFRSLSID